MSDLQNTLDRLDNWKKCYRDRKHYRVTPSLEGRYKPPPSWHPPEPKLFVDTLDAVIVEKALVNPSFPKKARALIVYSYMHPFIPLPIACRKIGINQRHFEAELKTAVNILHNRLN